MKSQIMELSHEVRQHLQIISGMSEMTNRNIDLISLQRRHYDILIGKRSEISVITQIMIWMNILISYIKEYK